MALPTSKQDYQYYFYVISRVVITTLLTFGVYEFVYLKYFLDTSLLEVAYLKYLYKVIINLRIDLITFWVSIVTLSIFLVLTMYFLAKNPHTLTIVFSRYARRSDVKKMKPSVLKEDGFCLGSFHSTMLRTNEPLGLLCVAPAGAGKTSGTVIPTILSCDRDSLIINDPKGELYDETSKYRRKISNVFRIEWGQEEAKRDSNTTYWNPLDLSNLPTGTAERSKYVDMITNILIKEAKGDKFWSSSARKTLSAMILYSIYKEELENKSTNIAKVKDILATIGVKDIDDEDSNDDKDASQEGFLIKARELEELNFPESIKLRCKNVFSELSSTSPNTLGSILATISSDLSVFNSEYVRDITSQNSFSMTDIRGEGAVSKTVRRGLFFKKKTIEIKKPKPTTVYLISPAAEQELFGVLSAIFVEVAYKYITSQDLAVVKKSNIVRFILDEVAFFPPISAVVDGPAIARGYRGSFLFVCQDFGQFIDKYGEAALNTILTNSAFKIVLPQNNDKTAERLAKLSGQTQIKEWTGTAKTRQRVKKIVDLISTTDVLSLPAGKQIVFVQNNAKTPIFCNIPFYFKDKEMLKKLGKRWYQKLWKKIFKTKKN